MDIFSGIKNIQNNHYEPNTLKNQNINNINKVQSDKTQIEKNNEIQKHQIEKKSKDEIKKELQKIVEELNREMNPLNIDLKFKFNDKIDELTVMVIDKKTNEVIREFPPKEALKLMEKMRELVGMLFDKKG